MIFSLLADADSTAADTSSSTSSVVTWVIFGVIIVALIAMMVFSSKRNKKRQKEAENLINAVRPGNKVKTIGGICGIVVEVDDAENTFILETGSETAGKCFMKFDKQAIYQTDAVVAAESKDAKAEAETENVDVVPAESTDAETAADPVEEKTESETDGADKE